MDSFSGFTILIPTWNNIQYLQLCLKSIAEHSQLQHHIIVLVNEGKDGTKEWVASQTNIQYIHFPENLGICITVNKGAQLAKTDYILYMNDDMYVLPGWDIALKKEMENIGHEKFFLSSTMIEPNDTGNDCVIVKDYGNSQETFREEALLKEFQSFQKNDWNGATWPPNIMHKNTWNAVGGFSEEFSPGMYSDPDLSMKLWQYGIRYFKGLSGSRVYHFGTKSTGRIKQNDGKKTFLKKWGITPGDFALHFLKRGTEFKGPLPEVSNDIALKIKGSIKKLFS